MNRGRTFQGVYAKWSSFVFFSFFLSEAVIKNLKKKEEKLEFPCVTIKIKQSKTNNNWNHWTFRKPKSSKLNIKNSRNVRPERPKTKFETAVHPESQTNSSKTN